MTRPLSEQNYAEMSSQLDKTGTVDMSKLTPVKVRLKNNNEESRSQKTLIRWWSSACKRYDIPEQLLFAIPNGMAFGGKEDWQRKTSAIRAKNAKLEGLRPGWPDLMLAVPMEFFDGGHLFYMHSLFIEMKVAKGVVKPEQTLIHSLLIARGFKVVVCRSTEEAIEQIEEYLK